MIEDSRHKPAPSNSGNLKYSLLPPPMSYLLDAGVALDIARWIMEFIGMALASGFIGNAAL